MAWPTEKFASQGRRESPSPGLALRRFAGAAKVRFPPLVSTWRSCHSRPIAAIRELVGRCVAASPKRTLAIERSIFMGPMSAMRTKLPFADAAYASAAFLRFCSRNLLAVLRNSPERPFNGLKSVNPKLPFMPAVFHEAQGVHEHICSSFNSGMAERCLRRHRRL